MHRARRGLLVLVAGKFSLSQPGGRGQTNASTPQDTHARPRHCRRWLRLTLGDVARGAAGRLQLALLALVGAPPRSVCRASPCWGKPYREAPPTRPTPSLRPRSPTPPEVCLETMEFDIRCTHGTTTTHAPHSSPKVAWDTTSTRCQVGRSWRLRLHERRLTGDHPERNQVHTVTPTIKKQFSLSIQPETRQWALET